MVHDCEGGGNYCKCFSTNNWNPPLIPFILKLRNEIKTHDSKIINLNVCFAFLIWKPHASLIALLIYVLLCVDHVVKYIKVCGFDVMKCEIAPEVWIFLHASANKREVWTMKAALMQTEAGNYSRFPPPGVNHSSVGDGDTVWSLMQIYSEVTFSADTSLSLCSKIRIQTQGSLIYTYKQKKPFAICPERDVNCRLRACGSLGRVSRSDVYQFTGWWILSELIKY